MRETFTPSEIVSEKNRLRDISERLGSPPENFSVEQADQKLAQRLEIGEPVDVGADEKLDKQISALKDEINELLAERYHTSPEFEALRSKSKINRLTSFEKIQYAYLSQKYPERANISHAEQLRVNSAYAAAKQHKLDFQIVETLRLYKREYESGQATGEKLSTRESDLYDKLSEVYATRILEETDEAVTRAEEILRS